MHADSDHTPAGRWTRRDLARSGAWLAMGIAAAPALIALSGCERAAGTPSFRYTPLDGRTRDSATLRGRPVVLQFWATTCAVCMAEMPDWEALYRTWRPRGLHLLAVAVQADPPARVAMVAESRGLPFEVVIDNTGEIARAFGDVRATPTGFLLDAQGRVAWSWVGAVDHHALQARLTALLAG